MLAADCSDIEDEINYNENEVKVTKAYSLNKEFIDTMIPGKDNGIASEAVDKLIELDPMLTQFKPQLMKRYNSYLDLKDTIQHYGEGLDNFSMGYKVYGFNRTEDGIWYREWAPGAAKAFLTGEFSNYHIYFFSVFFNLNFINIFQGKIKKKKKKKKKKKEELEFILFHFNNIENENKIN